MHLVGFIIKTRKISACSSFYCKDWKIKPENLSAPVAKRWELGYNKSD